LSIASVLHAFGRAANQARARWYLFGAQAVALYGVPRTTADVDITVVTEDFTAGHLLAPLRRAGFQATVSDPAFVARTRVLPLVHQRTGLPVDVVLAGPGLEEEFVARVRMVDVGRRPIPVIAPEDLVVVKLLAGRVKDLEDVRALLARSDLAIDRRRVGETVAVLEALLGRSDLHRELAKLEPRRRRQRSPRRASRK
jgi:hypothetical protein